MSEHLSVHTGDCHGQPYFFVLEECISFTLYIVDGEAVSSYADSPRRPSLSSSYFLFFSFGSCRDWKPK